MTIEKIQELIGLCSDKHNSFCNVTIQRSGFKSYISNGIDTLYGHLEHNSLEEVLQRLENHLAIDDIRMATKDSLRELIIDERSKLEDIQDKIEGLELKLQMLD